MSQRCTDRELLELYAGSRDADAFRALVERYQRLVLGTCRSVLRNEAWAEDAAQATFLLMHEKAKSLVKHGSLAGWLVKTSRLVSTNMRRKELRHSREIGLGPDVSGRKPEVTAEVEEAFSGLTAEQQALLWMRVGEELAFRDMGLTLGISEDAARVRCKRAMDALRSRLPHFAGVAGLSQLETSLCSMMRGPVPDGFGQAVVNAAVGTGAVSSGVVLALQGLKQTMRMKTAAMASVSTLTVLVLTGLGMHFGGMQVAQAKKVDPKLDSLSALVGTWKGTLSYANYSDDARESLAAEATITRIPNGFATETRYPGYRGSAGGKTTYEFDTERGLVNISDMPGRHKVSGLGDPAKDGVSSFTITGVVREEVRGFIQDVPMRITVEMGRDSLVMRRETRDPLEFRNEYRLTRVR